MERRRGPRWCCSSGSQRRRRGSSSLEAPSTGPAKGPSLLSAGMAEHDAISADELITRLQARIEERRREGAYPPDLEGELEDHFARVLGRPPSQQDVLRAALGRLEQAMAFSSEKIPL